MNWAVAAGASLLVWLVLLALFLPLARRRTGSVLSGRAGRAALAAAFLVGSAVLAASFAPAESGSAQVPTAAETRAAPIPRGAAEHLDRARQHLAGGAAEDAISEYIAVLRIDNRNPEAYATLGYLLHLAGRSDDGLWSVEQALTIDPNYTDAYYFRGAILISATDRQDEGVRSLYEYLRRAPDGNHRADCRKLLELAGRPMPPGAR